MNLLKTSLAVLLLACAQISNANSDPVSIETKWNEKTVSFTTSTVTSFTFDVGGFGAAGYAVYGATYNANGVDGTTYGALLPFVSSVTTNVIGADYTFTATGSTASMKIAQTIKTPPPAGVGFRGVGPVVSTSNFNSPFPSVYLFTIPVISTSSAIIMSTGSYTHSFRAEVTNPIFYFTGLLPSSTYTITVDYLIPHIQ